MSKKYGQVPIPRSAKWKANLYTTLVKAFGEGNVRPDGHNAGVWVVASPERQVNVGQKLQLIAGA